MKFAIFKNKIGGLVPLEFWDSKDVVVKYPYIDTKSLPVVINDVGGYTHFDPKLSTTVFSGLEFLEIREGEATDAVTTFQERWPLQEPFRCGWISPEGTTYSCASYGHSDLAIDLFKLLETDYYSNAERELEDRGWCKVTISRSLNGKMEYRAFTEDCNLTQAQLNVLVASGMAELSPWIRDIIYLNTHRKAE